MTELAAPPVARPTYGIDAPNILIGLAGASILALLVGFFMSAGRSPVYGAAPWVVSALLAAAAVWVARGTTRTKPRVWRAALDDLALTGTEHSLDLGCGRGLVLIETATRLPGGHAEAVDIWRNRDQSGNRRVTTELNARIVGVAERVTIHDADMTRLPFADDTFDLVTAGFSLRCLTLPAERAQAVGQLARVLRPGGRAIVLDDAHTAELADQLRAAGLTDVVRSDRLLGFGPPARLITATAPS